MANIASATSPRKSSRRSQLPEEVASYVRELIISGSVRPGEFLRMEPIAEAMGVSNTPVREGLFSLRSEGLVDLVPRRGFVVAQFSAEDIQDLFWAQAKLAGELAARAAERITAEEINHMRTLLDDYESVNINDDEQGIANVGHQFHRAVNLAADSRRLARTLGSIVRQLPNTFYAAIDGQVDATRDEHPEIFEALKNHDPEAARNAMEKHLLDEGDRLIHVLSARGVWAEPESDIRTAS